ncbi:hypothetical protein QP531_06675 [Peptoniphilus harei]|uniref:hypothetical protein n=1 Tax=Peptoniphilus harei TaxID=54005 RepID=UPI00254AD859|nr:hypothetical protein [Peptoniphilus harei]MDK7377501.1 hypothetical protein [Peptoniphilus harei]MDK7679813.1 hypothetical protein [Peptoniphilus harei]
MKKKKKEKKTPTYQVTYEQIEAYIKQGYEKGRKDSVKKATDFALAVPLLTLRDEFGFESVRLERFLKESEKTYEGINEGYLTIQDILNTLEEEVGLVLTGWK